MDAEQHAEIATLMTEMVMQLKLLNSNLKELGKLDALQSEIRACSIMLAAAHLTNAYGPSETKRIMSYYLNYVTELMK